MKATMMAAMLLLGMVPLGSQGQPELSFEAASIKPTAPDDRSGRFITMQGAHQFVAKGYTVKFMVMAAYNQPSRGVMGGPPWIDVDRYDILAATPGEARPSTAEQMSMLRSLLSDRLKLALHREQRELPIYELTVARGRTPGAPPPGLKEPAAPREQPVLVNRVFPGRIQLPARNATMAEFASMLQRSVFDRHVVDNTGLSGRYDFDLDWTPDDTQFGGRLPPATADTPTKPDLFAAMQQQLGLRLQASKGNVDILVIDRVERP